MCCDELRLGCAHSCALNGACQAAAKAVKEKFEHVHLLINAAGILHIPGKLSPGARSPGRAVSSCGPALTGVLQRRA